MLCTWICNEDLDTPERGYWAGENTPPNFWILILFIFYKFVSII